MSALTTPDPAPVIRVEGVWKRFQVNESRPALRHEASTILRRLVHRRVQPTSAPPPFWALQDVNLQIQRGESVGIIGSNGAGKSTLFRLMCGVSEPTRGQIAVHGRFAALIALGAGFNPELSGLDNIWMSAAIQGLRRAETARLLPDILDFAELGDAIHIPVKRYSSGMYARLGFSIALHSMPDIVFLDEILTVGDAAFQQKCRERILQFRSEGRTMLFVSHAAAEVRLLCQRAIWLDQGSVMRDGPANAVIDAFETHLGVPSTRTD
jgi:ABC-type polysaccharide/polyol phosphate transport system ATPase subunit